LRLGWHFANGELQNLLGLFAQQLNPHGSAHWRARHGALEIQWRLNDGTIELSDHIARNNAGSVRWLIV
jgi:hypothetical protein